MTRGLLIEEKFIEQMLTGKKKYEYRNFTCPYLDEKIILVKLGCAYGTVIFDKNCKGNKKFKYGWHIKSYKKFKTPKKYKHPQGAQRWIKNVKFTGLCKKTDKFPCWTSK